MGRCGNMGVENKLKLQWSVDNYKFAKCLIFQPQKLYKLMVPLLYINFVECDKGSLKKYIKVDRKKGKGSLQSSK